MITALAFFIVLLIGLPIFFALLVGTVVFLQQSDLLVLMSSLPIQLFGSLNQNGLLAIPLFMLVGELMNKGGLTKRLMGAADVFVGGFKGGLAYVNLLTNAMASSILGSAAAQISVMSRLMIPTMVEKGYKKDFAAAVTISGGLLGSITPPSMLMIIYGVVAYQSISDLFIAGLLPGLLIIGGFAVVIMLFGIFTDLPAGEHVGRTNIRRILLNGVIPGTIPVTVILFIVMGIMTPTEAGAIASIMAFIIGTFIYKGIKLKDLPAIFATVALNTATITGLIATAFLFGWALSFEGVPDLVVEYISGLTNSPLMFLLITYVVVILLGLFLESISVMIVIVPIILPAALAFGIDPIHFGIVICLATLVGLITPPVGPGLFIAMQATNLSMGALLRAMVPFLISLFICLMLIAAFPSLSLYLPNLMNG